jgi:ESX secretion system protein EccE
VTGTREFHIGTVARLALSGLPVALHIADVRPWTALANHGAPQQFSAPPAPLPPGAIVVTEGGSEAPASPITVTLRRPQTAKAPATTIVITQDGKHANLFRITTPQGDELLSTRLVGAAARR